MNASDLIPWVQGLYAFILVLLLAVIGAGYWFRGKIETLNTVRSSLSILNDCITTQTQLIGTVIGALRRQKTLGDAELTEIGKLFVQSHKDVINRTLAKEAQTHNPLSQEELNKLNKYVKKAQNGELFNQIEIEEYNALVQKLKGNTGGVDPGVVALVGLGALLLGIFLGSRGK